MPTGYFHFISAERVVGKRRDVLGLDPVSSLTQLPGRPKARLHTSFPRHSSQSGDCRCLKHNSFTPVVASRELRIGDAICHLRGVICPLMIYKQVNHHAALGGRRTSVSRPLEAQLSRAWAPLAEYQAGILTSPQAGSPGPLFSPEGLALLPGGRSGFQDRVCLEWESLSVPGGRLPSPSGGSGVASWDVPL